MWRRVTMVLLLLAIGWTAWTSLTQIDAGERGVVKRFGRIESVALPGLHIGLPWGIDRVTRVRIDRDREVTIGFQSAMDDELDTEVPPGQILTGDHNLINVQVTIRFAVHEDQVTQFALYGDRADGLVARLGEALLAQWVAGRKVDDVLLEGKEVLPRWLPGALEKRIADYDLGVRVQLVSVSKELSPPRQVKDAFESVMRAQAEIETKANQAQQDAELRWTEALNYKKTLEDRVAVYAASQKSLAETDAETFLARSKQIREAQRDAPNYLTALWWDEVTKLYTRMYEQGRLDLLDNRLSGSGIDIFEQPLMPRKKSSP